MKVGESEREFLGTRKIVSLVVAICCFFVILSAGCFGNDVKIVGTPEMYTEYNSYLGYSAEIVGTVKNNGHSTCDYVQVEFSVYDVNGNNLGTAIDNMNNLGAGETWQFSATLFSFPSTKPVSYRLIEITYW